MNVKQVCGAAAVLGILLVSNLAAQPPRRGQAIPVAGAAPARPSSAW